MIQIIYYFQKNKFNGIRIINLNLKNMNKIKSDNNHKYLTYNKSNK